LLCVKLAYEFGPRGANEVIGYIRRELGAMGMVAKDQGKESNTESFREESIMGLKG
jgi:hypothetical protein